MLRRWWVVAGSALAAVALLGFMLNGNIRYQVGVGRVSGYSVAETFSHRPILFRLLSAAQAWLPEQVSRLAGPTTSWEGIVVFESGFRLIAMLAAAGAAVLLWRGLARRWGTAAWPYGMAAFAALAFSAPATGEPDWMAAALTVAAVGAGLLWRPAVGAPVSGVLLALAALVKISTLPVAVAGLVVLWVLDRRRGWLAAAVALVSGLAAVGLIWWLAPWEISWLLDIKALQPDPWTMAHAIEARDYLFNLAARWPTVALLPAFFIRARRTEVWTALVGLVLTAFAFLVQGQYFVYHSLGFVTLATLLAVATIVRSRGALRWPLLVLMAWTFVLFLTPVEWRLAHPLRLYLITAAWVVILTGWQWWALRRSAVRLSRARTYWWSGLLVTLALLATQAPASAESLTLSTAGRTSVGATAVLRSDLAAAAKVHALIGDDTSVAYLTFGSDTYTLGNPTQCRYPSPLLLQRVHADKKVPPADREENLNCLANPNLRWLIWDRSWLRLKSAPEDVVTTIDTYWDCDSAKTIGRYTVCPRRP
ncbi:hypothetical protein [Propionicimonas paludicola]|nr:hypothetical protein [Propionicimonas paludicola]